MNNSGGVEDQPLLSGGTGATPKAAVVDREDMIVGCVCEGVVGGRADGLGYVAGVAVNLGTVSWIPF